MSHRLSWPAAWLLLYDLLRSHRALCCGAAGAGLAAALFEGATMAIFALALDLLASPVDGVWAAWPGLASLNLAQLRTSLGSTGLFFLLVGAAVAGQVLRSVLTFLSNVFAATLRTRIEADLRRRTFRQFVTLDLPSVSQYKIGDLLSYFEQVDQIGVFLERSNVLLIQLFLLLAYIAILLWVSWSVTLLALLVLLLLALPMRYATHRLRQISGQILQADVQLKERVVEILQALRLVHAFARQELVQTRIHEAINESAHVRRRSFVLYHSITPVFESVAVACVAILLVSGYLIGGQEQSLARLLAFVFVLYRLLPRVVMLNSIWGAMHTAWPYVARVAAFVRMDDKRYVVSGSRPFVGLHQGIEFRKVALRYEGSNQYAVNDLCLLIHKGQMAAIVGASGSGKSTIVNLLLRLYDPTEGQILVDGVNLRELNLAEWRGKIGVVDQETLLFHQSVADNIRFGELAASEADIEKAARIAHADEFVRALPEGLDTLIGDRGHRLSGGQRQRLAIARAIVRDPEILILDEATSQLDSQSERLIQDALDNLRREHTMIVVAHRLSTVAKADVIFVLEGGRITAQGTHEQLLVRSDCYAEWWRLQHAQVSKQDMETGPSETGAGAKETIGIESQGENEKSG